MLALVEPIAGEASVSLLVICGIAFAAVMVLLSLLAGLTWLITRLFPEAAPGKDHAIAGAIQAAVSGSLGGARVVRIEEIR